MSWFATRSAMVSRGLMPARLGGNDGTSFEAVMREHSLNPPFQEPPTFFAPAERESSERLREVVARVGESPLLTGLLELLGGWVAVLNDKRQILAVNHALLHALGIERPEEVLGLRPGEVLNCVHAQDHPGGCGTSQFCATCGAAIAIVAALETHQTEQRECILSYHKGDQIVDRAFAVQACPVQLDGDNLLLICMRDVSDEKRRAALERTFLHDISNLLSAIQIGAGILRAEPDTQDANLIAHIRHATAELVREVRVQKLLAADDPSCRSVELASVRPVELLSQVCAVLRNHPAGRGQEIETIQPVENEPLQTDPCLLSRVLTNMVMNALEAGAPGDRIRVGATGDQASVEFFVWNKKTIDPSTALRVFQQYFSTQTEPGRGLGTFSMKLLGERILGGAVSFTSTPEAGTTFRIRLPRVFGVVLPSGG
jgi:K+-sensing histidine kinase KdpD